MDDRFSNGLIGPLMGSIASVGQRLPVPPTEADIACTDYGTSSMPRSGRRPQHQTATRREDCAMSVLALPAQPVDATQALNLSAGVSNCKVSRGRSFS